MDYNEWKNKWASLWREWQYNYKKYDKELSPGESVFDRNSIAIYKFPNWLISKAANDEIVFVSGGFDPGTPSQFVKFRTNDRYFYIHYRCPDLPLVLKICESFGGTLDFWDSSNIFLALLELQY